MSDSESAGVQEGELTYEDIQTLCRDSLGTIIRFPESGEERVYFSRGEYTDQHETVIQAALWDRSDGREGHKTYILKGLENGRGGESIVADGSYAGDYCEAVEWIGDESEAFDGERINWLDLPKRVYSSAGGLSDPNA